MDLCSGKGFLSTMLAWEFPKARVYMCDNDESLELTHLSSLPTVHFHLQDLFSDEAEATVREAGRETKCIVVGIHLCGELSRRAIQIWRDTGAAALIMSPCCLPRRRRHDVFGFHVKDQAKKMKVSNYQLWCTMLYGLLPFGEAHCNMCVDDEHMCSPYSTFVTACRQKQPAGGVTSVHYGQTCGDRGGGRYVVPGRSAGKWIVTRRLADHRTDSATAVDVVA